MPGARDPKIIKYAKWITVIVGAVSVSATAASFLIVTIVKWAATPIVEQSERRGLTRDSVIVSRLEAVSRQVELVAQGLRSDPSTPLGDATLRQVPRVQPIPAELPADARPEKKDNL